MKRFNIYSPRFKLVEVARCYDKENAESIKHNLQKASPDSNFLISIEDVKPDIIYHIRVEYELIKENVSELFLESIPKQSSDLLIDEISTETSAEMTSSFDDSTPDETD